MRKSGYLEFLRTGFEDGLALGENCYVVCILLGYRLASY